jgi:hypothetical protein
LSNRRNLGHGVEHHRIGRGAFCVKPHGFYEGLDGMILNGWCKGMFISVSVEFFSGKVKKIKLEINYS